MHIGNYFGAVQNWVRLQDRFRCIYGVVDLHAMTVPYDAGALHANTRQMIIDLLACGIDPQRSILFIQSQVPEHTELAWIFNCLCPLGELKRMTQFKDKTEQQDEKGEGGFVSAGLLTYPILQAADILIYRAHKVPVGEDQTQHLELSREIARDFNGRFGNYFPEPQPELTRIPKVLSLADPTKKMSKSLGPKHYVGLFEDEPTVRSKVMSAVTDTGGAASGPQASPGVENLLRLLVACGKDATAAELEQQRVAGTLKYKILKEEVAGALVELTSGLAKRRAELMKDSAAIDRRIVELCDAARALAAETMREVRKRTGIQHRA